jgi:probable F420-dependent oxidoreductase
VVSHDATLRQTVNDAPSSLAEVATISGVDEANLARYGLASSTSRSRINGGFVRIGVVFPQNEIGADAGAIRAYGQRVEELGFSHVLAYDHVVGADPAAHQGWNGPYDVAATFHEPMVMFGFLASLTGLELVTGVIILPQRQTVLAAKQAAEVDLLTGGRFRLGVGLGWNRVEYEALRQDFATRSRRIEEQIELMRRLWTERSLSYSGRFDQMTGVGLAPLPVQRPIPVWFGAQSERAYRRAGRLADGWFPQIGPGADLDQARAMVEQAATAAGRDPARLGMEGRVRWRGDPEQLAEEARRWQESGASHLAVNTMGAGLATVDDHLVALAVAADATKALAD